MANRFDLALDDGAKLVLLREEDTSFVRLLVPKDGMMTSVTKRVPLDLDSTVGMAERLPYTAELDGLRVEVYEGPEGDRFRGDFKVSSGGHEARGRRLDLHQALWRF